MFISGGGESDLYAVMARTGDKGMPCQNKKDFTLACPSCRTNNNTHNLPEYLMAFFTHHILKSSCVW